MKRFFKWIGIILAGLIILLVGAGVILGLMGGNQMNQTRNVRVEGLIISDDRASVARGKHLTQVAFCTECHGRDLSGRVLFDEPYIGIVHSSNITGLGSMRTDADLVRAIRHGVGPDGRQLAIMPVDAFINLSAKDLAALIAYLKTVPRIGDDLPKPQLTYLGRILLAAGLFGHVFAAERIDHSQPFPAMPEISANEEYGAYVAKALCTGCHGKDFAGQRFDPAAPPAPNLTPGGRLAIYSEEDFINTLRTGVTPYEIELNGEFMPWRSFSNFYDDELKGIWMYLQSLPAKE
jgi:cytochrome c553